MSTVVAPITDRQHIANTLRHIEGVRDACDLLGHRLIDHGESDLGLDLIGLGLIHDYSKLHNKVEFTYLRENFKGTAEFDNALTSHVTTNLHHPEAWHGIEKMPRVYVAEMVCDWKARSEEFGSDLMEWIRRSATVRFAFSKRSRIWAEIKELTGILLDRPFKR